MHVTATGSSTAENRLQSHCPWSSSGTGTVPNTWVRLVRAAATAPIGSNCYFGLVASGSDTTLNISQFNNVSLTP